tara:strand:- start:410 stop:859 length:450 start_codon:yes stop_codon:yes gene_type:complete
MSTERESILKETYRLKDLYAETRARERKGKQEARKKAVIAEAVERRELREIESATRKAEAVKARKRANNKKYYIKTRAGNSNRKAYSRKPTCKIPLDSASSFNCKRCGEGVADVFWGIMRVNDANNAYHSTCLTLAISERNALLINTYR